MKMAGGIIAIVMGSISTIISILQIMAGSALSGFDAGMQKEFGTDATGAGEMVMLYSFVGLVCCILVIVFGAMSIKADIKRNSIILIVSSVLGLVFGGYAFFFMLIALVGGILALIGTGSAPAPEMQMSSIE